MSLTALTSPLVEFGHAEGEAKRGKNGIKRLGKDAKIVGEGFGEGVWQLTWKAVAAE